MIIKNMNNESRPCEKLLKLGADSLTDEELLALILKTGTRDYNSIELSSIILKMSDINGKIIGLSRMGYEDLIKIHGIGKIKAAQILALFEISKRITTQSREKLVDFHKPSTVAMYYMERMRHLEKEQVILIMLDNKCSLIKDMVISKGTVNTSLISTREIFIEALKSKAVYIMLLHNHPSGDPTPSNTDLEITDTLKDASIILNIPLLDHIIIGDNNYYSLREHERGH